MRVRRYGHVSEATQEDTDDGRRVGGAVYTLCIHRLVVMSTEPIVLAASRTTLVDLRTWSHIICGTADTNRAFRTCEITVILKFCASLGILMTSSLSGVRANPLEQSTAVSWVVFILWMGRASSCRLIAHMIHMIHMKGLP